ncbi:MAG: rhomboid family intramembrane serine protease, partial [Pseudomonadota bacterium]
GLIAPLFSHMALHANFMHILFNSVWLLALGAPVARRLGAGTAGAGVLPSSLFISFFALSGAAGALLYILFNLESGVLLVGASGGVSGLLGAVIRFAFAGPVHFARGASNLTPLTDRRIIIWSILIIVMNIFLAFFGGPGTGGSDIAWEAHVGGYLFGVIAFPLFDGFSRRYR